MRPGDQLVKGDQAHAKPQDSKAERMIE